MRSKTNPKKKVDAVKAIYNTLGIPALAEKKVNHYFEKGFQSLDKMKCDDGKKSVLKKFAEELIARQA